MKNKVLLISPLGYTGMAYYDYSLCQSLSKAGVDVELATSNRWVLSNYERDFKISHLYYNCSGNIRRSRKGANYLLAVARIFLRALTKRKKIVHFGVSEIPAIDLILMVSLRLLGKKIVFTPHDIFHNKNYPLSKFSISLAYTVANKIIAHKEANVHTLARDFRVPEEKIRIIPHGSYEYFVDRSINSSQARRILGICEDEKVLLFFGNIRPGKGHDLLIKATSLLRNRIERLKLLIAGRPISGITEESLRNLIAREAVADISVCNCSFIPTEKVTSYYMAADIVVLPYTKLSESGVLRYAQTCGKAVVCSDLDEFTDTVKPGVTGYLFRSGDVQDLADTIEEAFIKGDYGQVGLNARALMDSNYTWNKVANLTKELYNSL
jgi:glycosyltransferase involved in cell wall biosynthesis